MERLDPDCVSSGFGIVSEALAAWDRSIGLHRGFRRGELRASTLYADDRIISERSTILTLASPDPLDAMITWLGSGIDIYQDRRRLYIRVRDFIDESFMLAAAAAYHDVLASGRPQIHRIKGMVESNYTELVRVVFPVHGVTGDIEQLVSCSQELVRHSPEELRTQRDLRLVHSA